MQPVSDSLCAGLYDINGSTSGPGSRGSLYQGVSDFYGPRLVSVFKTPIPYMPILASGGIDLKNLKDYVLRGVDCCGFGSLLTKGSREEIAANARSIRTLIDEARQEMQTTAG